MSQSIKAGAGQDEPGSGRNVAAGFDIPKFANLVNRAEQSATKPTGDRT